VTKDKKQRKELKIENELGIHARPAALIVKTCNKFESEIVLEKDGNEVSGKSIIGLLTLEGNPGSDVTVTAIGDDARQAIEALEDLFRNKFFDD